MKPRTEVLELAACGAAAGAVGAWGLAAAARVGWLRVLLDLFPRASWDAVTWGMIPAVLLAPLILQGMVVAALGAARPIPAGRGVAGSVGGTLLFVFTAGAVFAGAERYLPASVIGKLARALPPSTMLLGGLLVLAGWLLAAGRALGSLWLRRAAVPLAILAGAAAWMRARGWVLAAANVLDRAEAVVFFTAVVVGGTLGSVWATRRDARDLTAPKNGRYNVRNLPDSIEPGDSGEGRSRRR
ncbi:MAG TPA: hypothetical protein VKV57_03655 [bacterium]|nr:hypothetical protein [bacterium]